MEKKDYKRIDVDYYCRKLADKLLEFQRECIQI